MTKPQDEALEFASFLLGKSGCPDNTAALVWSLPSKRNRWAATAERLVKEALALDAKGEDVYIGVALRNPKTVTVGRGGNSDCTHLLALVIDIDIGTNGDKKRRFPDIETALAAVRRAFPIPPTLIVASGGGLHLWWLFREPLDLSDPAVRAEAELVAMAWNRRIIDVAAADGYAVDSVYDPARVLRVPGTHNRKYGTVRPVHLVESNATAHYDLSDFRDAMGEEALQAAQSSKVAVTVSGERLILSPDAKPDLDKLEALRANIDKVNQLLSRAPACYTFLRDHSASAFDLALANIAVRAGWDDQEVANLLVWNRAKHGDDLKLREGYYAKTIAKARAGYDGTLKAAREAAAATEFARAEDISAVAKIPDPEERRAEILLLLAGATGVNVARIVSNGRDPARYRVITASGDTLFVESTDRLMMQKAWHALGIETNSKVPADPLSPKNWHRLVAQLAQVVEFESEEDSFENLVNEYLSGAVEIEDPEHRDQRNGILQSRRPALIEGRPALHLSSFTHWLADGGQKMERSNLKARLKALGFATRTVFYGKTGHGRTSTTYWVASTARGADGPDPRRGLRLVEPDVKAGGDDGSFESGVAKG